MNKQLTVFEVEDILKGMKQAQEEHPKTSVVYDLERNQILIVYPLPKDYEMLREVSRGIPPEALKDY